MTITLTLAHLWLIPALLFCVAAVGAVVTERTASTILAAVLYVTGAVARVAHAGV